jgi:predicted nuclease of predicted toxin-antitoxin system
VEAGHDTEHVRDLGLQAAPDAVVLQRAREHSQVLVSADTDFGTLLARTGADRPSVILIRRSSARRAIELASLLLSNLDAITDDLKSGAVVVITDTDLRVRTLPIPPGPRGS